MRAASVPALIVHGGAGARAAAGDGPARRRGMLAAAEAGARVLRGGGSALDAAVAAVVTLENDPLFNAGYGSMLNAAGKIEMDAGVMMVTARGGSRSAPARGNIFGTGAAAAVSRVRNPILLARAVMERTRHVLMVGESAERIASAAGIKLCRARDLVTPRALDRWKRRAGQGGAPMRRRMHGTVGAAAERSRGATAAATSTGGYPRRLAGRVGDSAIVGAGFFAAETGAASATGLGEAIIKLALCREAVMALRRASAQVAAARAIAAAGKIPVAEAGIVVIDRKGGFAYAHNAQAMEVAMFDPLRGVRHEMAKRQS